MKPRRSDQVDHVKLILTEGIAAKIRTRYASQREAAAKLEFDVGAVSRLCNGQYERFSLNFLINLATRLGARIGVTVE